MMKIVFFNNTLNRHQSNVADFLYELTNGSYRYVETVSPRADNKVGGKKQIERPYVICAYKSQELWNEALSLACNADVAVFGAGSLPFEVKRMRTSAGLAFEVSERWLKRGWINLLSPRLLQNMWYYHTECWKSKPLYKLCSSAYGAGDQYKLKSFEGRCYKWGYFTEVEDLNIESLLDTSRSNKVSILWCARFLKLKHPELVIQLARRLKTKGYDVHFDMYGAGEELEPTQILCHKQNVQDIVSFKGNVSNDEIISAMRQHDIFLFTSDRHEGWGAVLNEAMSNGCTVVASNSIGSVPFLIGNEKNGLIFESGSLESLYEKVSWLIEHPQQRRNMAINAYYTMHDIWSPRQGAMNLLQLIDDLLHGRETSILEGPCSIAMSI